MEGTVVDETVKRTVDWAHEMQDWLVRYESHVQELCTSKEIPKPPHW